MTRCDYDTIFQRVFCVTLVAIAFTFTVILTNVFVDIDGLLSRKDKVSVKTMTNPEPVFDNEKQVNPSPNDLAPPLYYKLDSLEDSEDNYRSKRSLESQNFLFRIRNPKMKGILTSRLATLLEELDEEESTGDIKTKDKRPNREKEIEDFAKDVYLDENRNPHKELKSKHDSSNTKEDLIHLAMHNILLQGIIGHMDLNEVYRKVHKLIDNFKKTDDDDEEMRKHHLLRKQASPMKILNEISDNIDHRQNTENFDDRIRIPKTNEREIKPTVDHKPFVAENKFFKEMAECEKLESDVNKMAEMKSPDKARNKEKLQMPNVLINTIIDITSLKKNKTHKQDNVDSKERVKGIIRLIYNGKSVKFSKMDDEGVDVKRFNDHIPDSTSEVHQKKYEDKPFADAEFNDAIEILQAKRQDKSDAFLSDFLSEYIIKDPRKLTNTFLDSVDSRHKYKAKRYKRQIKIRYQDVDAEKKKVIPKKFSLAKTDDDELYVEIETHFDSKGMKGEKKRKLIRNLIDKIQKAINSDTDLMNDNKKTKHKRYHVKKRIQHPLDKNRTLSTQKVMIPIDSIVERHSNPISKTIPIKQQDSISPLITDKSGETWRKAYRGPSFLTVAKSVNSAEMGEVNINYSKMLPSNEIPARQQIPINKDSSVETPDTNSFFDMGDLKFFIKDIDGTGLSIGFNQYTDEAPDPERMKAFTGVENIITNYRQNEDQSEKPGQEENHSLPASIEKDSHGVSEKEITSNSKQHVVIRRSVKEVNDKDYHSNEYKIIFNGNFLPYDNYEEIIEDKNKKISFKLNKEAENIYPFEGQNDETDFRRNIKLNELPALIGDNIFYKKLKPAEILNLASMINRKKRGITNKQVTSIKRKIKLNKFINSHSRFSPKKIILSKKRSKRQIDKIRIIATDDLNKAGNGRESQENILFVSNENLFADRAMVRDTEGLTHALNEMAMREKNLEENVHNTIPYAYDDTATFNPFSEKFGMPLMSRYPHIIMEEVSTSNEQFDPYVVDNMALKSMKVARQNDAFSQVLEQTTESITPPNMPDINIDKTLNNVESRLPKQNYKLTVRILPRNVSNLNSGFKEIHTSINKSFNRNGKIYSTLFNVSEISKIENANPTVNPTTSPTTTIQLSTKPYLTKRIEDQQAKMDLLLQQHRERIDEQLKLLKAERDHIEAIALNTILVDTKKATEDNENKTLTNNFDMNQLLALIKTEAQKETTTPPTTTTTTVAPDLEKIKIVDTIKKNENFTMEILHQINKNTEMLQTFLMKLSDRFQKVDTKSKAENEEARPISRDDKIWKPLNIKVPYSKDQYNETTITRNDKIWNPSNIIQVPYSNDQYNETHGPVPFFYAFQHPYPLKREFEKVPIASVVYQGLIHTLKNNNNAPRTKEEVINQTKYFIDGLENGFKDMENDKDMGGVVKVNELTNAHNLSSIKF